MFKINNVSLIYETSADKNPKAKRNACFCCELNCDASSFNYIANEWEPVIEIFDFLGQANVTPNKTEVFILSTSGFFHSFIYFRWRKGQEVEHIFVDLKNIIEELLY